MTGSDEYSARWKSLLRVSFSSWLALAKPNSATVKPSWRSCAFETAFRIGWILSSAFSWSPAISNWTSAERRSLETWPPFPGASGERTFWTFGCAETVRSTSSTAARNCGSESVCVFDSTSTLSPARFGKPASRSIVSAVFVSPAAVSASFSIFVPATDPRATATTQNAIQPERAVFQWPALHRPARAATLNLIAPPPLIRLCTPPGCLPPGVARNGESHRLGVRLPPPSAARRRGDLPAVSGIVHV